MSGPCRHSIGYPAAPDPVSVTMPSGLLRALSRGSGAALISAWLSTTTRAEFSRYAVSQRWPDLALWPEEMPRYRRRIELRQMNISRLYSSTSWSENHGQKNSRRASVLSTRRPLARARLNFLSGRDKSVSGHQQRPLFRADRVYIAYCWTTASESYQQEQRHRGDEAHAGRR